MLRNLILNTLAADLMAFAMASGPALGETLAVPVLPFYS